MSRAADLLLRLGDTQPIVPTAGQISFYAKSDGVFYSLDSNGVETPLAGGTGTVTSVSVLGNPSRIVTTGNPITSSGVIDIDLATTGVTAGSYTSANVTVDAYGRVTSISNGSGGGGSGTVTSVSGTGSVSGLTLTGTVTTTGNLTLGGTLSLTSSDITTGLGFTPYNATNPAGYTSNTGTVTSVEASGGTTGLTFTGGPITTSGTITMGGTLALANGGTGATTQAGAANAILPSQATNSGKFLTTDGTNVSWATISGTGTVTSVSATGSADITVGGSPITTSGTLTFALSNTGVTAGTYTKVTVDAKGRVTTGASLASSDVTTALGFTPYNATNPAGYTSNTGTVTSVTTSGGTTGLTLSTTNPTSTPSITLAGTLAIANGGTGQTTANAAFNALAPSQTGNSGKVLTTDGTNTSWTSAGTGTVTSVGVTTTASRITVSGSPVTSSGNIALDLATTAVTPGSYTLASITVDAYGRITSASSGSAGAGTVTSVSGSGGTTGLTLTGGPITTSGTLTLGGTLAIANGGTGATTQQAAINALAGAVTSGTYLRGNGTNVVMSAIQAADVPTLNQNTTGSAATLTTARTIAATGDASWSVSFNGSANVSSALTLANTGVTAGTYGSATSVPVITVDSKGRITNVTNTTITGGGTVTSVSVDGGTTGLTFTGSPITTSGTITMGGTLGLSNGGTGATTQAGAANAILPSQSTNAGKFLTTDGTNVSWATVSGTGTVTSITAGTGLTGGTITTTGTIALANTAVTPGSYTNANITVDAQGRITSASNGSGGGGSGTVTSVGLTSSGTLVIGNSPITTSGNMTVDLATSGVTPATYGSATQVPVFAVDSYGRITSVTNTTITGGGATGLTETVIFKYDTGSGGAMTGVDAIQSQTSGVTATVTSGAACTCTFTFTGKSNPPKSIMTYAQNTSTNNFVAKDITGYLANTFAGGGTVAAPAILTSFTSSNVLTVTLTQANTGAVGGIGLRAFLMVVFGF